jgi:hypothetical protein
MEAWFELRKAWVWAELTDAEFVERAEQIGMGRVARELIAKDLTTAMTDVSF